MIRVFMRRVHYWRQHARLLGLWRGTTFSAYEALGLRKTLRVCIGGNSLQLRTSTPDLSVARSSLVDGEYSQIKTNDPRIIIDAGANIGTTSIFFASKYPNAVVYAIEPEIENFALLVANTKPFANVRPINAALWGKDEQRVLRDRLTGPWGYTVSDSGDGSRPLAQTVACICMKSLIEAENIDSIDLLKMDIEGGEKDVFENCDEWIDSVKIVTCELHDRIIPGCSQAFSLATKDFVKFEKNGEKITAYRS